MPHTPLDWAWVVWAMFASAFARLIYRDWHDPDKDRRVTFWAGFIIAALMALVAGGLAALS